MLAILLLALVAPAWCFPRLDVQTCGYETCTEADPNMLNIHIVPHTHDDVGWLKTVDQYYYGGRNDIQLAGVQYIIDSVVKELWADPKRRFMYVETAFFWKWWNRQNEKIKNRVHTLVKEGRLKFVSGAWSMNDEAATHYQSTIDQFTWGLRKLNDTFGHCGMPTVGWQIDPFGHSREFASLLAAMGYDGLFLGRIDYQDKRQRFKNKAMEMVWRGNDDLGHSSDIFTGVLYNTYSPPPGFCFDILCRDEPIVDEISSPMYNVGRRIEEFLNITRYNMAEVYQTNNILITMGEDFNYQMADMWFENLDKLITYANRKSAKDGLNVKLFYSTPDCYLKAVFDSNPKLPIKQDDFFPYASDPHAYWTGYFTSKPTTKYFERQGNGYLQMAKQLQVTAGLIDKQNTMAIDELRSAMGIWQHHDAITGTEKDHVTHDYERILDEAIEGSLVVPRQAFNNIIQGSNLKPSLFSFDRCRLNESQCQTSETKNKFVVTLYNPLGWEVTATPVRIPVTLGTFSVVAPNGEEIEYQLVEVLPNLFDMPSRGKSVATHELIFIALNINPLGVKSFYISKEYRDKRDTSNIEIHEHNYWKRIQNDNNPSLYYKIHRDSDPSQSQVPGAHSSIGESPRNIKAAYSSAGNLEHPALKADLHRAGQKMKHSNPEVLGDQISKVVEKRKLSFNNLMMDDPLHAIVQRHEDLKLENEQLKLIIDSTTGHVSHLVLPHGDTIPFTIKFAFYPGMAGKNTNSEDRASGAYIFRPDAEASVDIPIKNTNLIKGYVVDELQYEASNFIYGSIRLYKNRNVNYIEHNWVVGPIPVDDHIGKEIVVKYGTDIKNNGEFYTDSNGRQMLKRRLNSRPDYDITIAEPIAGNYYPVTNKIYIKDNDYKLTVLTDRSEGGTSLHQGEIELMLHRRLLDDDGFGVGEALNEMDGSKGIRVAGNHRILISESKDKEAKIDEEVKVLELHLEPKVFVSSALHVNLSDWLTLNNCVGLLTKDLPSGIHLLTLEEWEVNKFLIRLENIYEKTDLANTDVEVDLSTIFSSLTLISMKETYLAANRWMKDGTEKFAFNTKNSFNDNFNVNYGVVNGTVRAPEKVSVRHDSGFKVTLKAKEIRTFIVSHI